MCSNFNRSNFRRVCVCVVLRTLAAHMEWCDGWLHFVCNQLNSFFSSIALGHSRHNRFIMNNFVYFLFRLFFFLRNRILSIVSLTNFTFVCFSGDENWFDWVIRNGHQFAVVDMPFCEMWSYGRGGCFLNNFVQNDGRNRIQFNRRKKKKADK